MDQKAFLEKVGALFDSDAQFKPNPFGNSQRSFTDTERTTFLQHLWEIFKEEPVDFESAVFVLALQKVQQRYGSVQEQAAHLGDAIRQIGESLKTKFPAVITP